ncbi:MAG: rRNA small subunit methyltransferase 1, partial [Deltaproteobacteria bacterium]|nr:rRNA small subunit methyltransferase 1 [Deltaproteobacteria bacterium]
MEGYGTLFVVATPIGNLEDITIRAIRVLKEADLIAAEDTRHTRKLLNHYNVPAPLTSYFEHNKAEKGDYIIKKLLEGKDVALVSDAGTPGISDPGYNLIKKAIDSGIKIVPVPGASALIAAISISGLT